MTNYQTPEQRVRAFIDSAHESEDYIETGFDLEGRHLDLTVSDIRDVLNRLDEWRNLARERLATIDRLSERVTDLYEYRSTVEHAEELAAEWETATYGDSIQSEIDAAAAVVGYIIDRHVKRESK